MKSCVRPYLQRDDEETSKRQTVPCVQPRTEDKRAATPMHRQAFSTIYLCHVQYIVFYREERRNKIGEGRVDVSHLKSEPLTHTSVASSADSVASSCTLALS